MHEHISSFELGWKRARKRFNHATRRQMKKAASKDKMEEFAVGWYLSKLFCLVNKN